MIANTRIDQIVLPELKEYGISISVKRDDLIDAQVSGNKLYKLKYNAIEAQKAGVETILTFGGAFSNHIAATAAYTRTHGLKSIGIIRGERPEPLNPTLAFAEGSGMQLHFISRSDYRKKAEPGFLDALDEQFNHPFMIPEGGANDLGIQGAQEMLSDTTKDFNLIAVAMGTGTTFAGLVKAAQEKQQVIGFPVHKHDRLLDDILQMEPDFEQQYRGRFEIINGHHFGGYAKWTPELLDFIRTFHDQSGIPLDPIYTGKAMHALVELIRQGRFEKGTRILFMHTGGLQAVPGFEQRFGVRLF